MITAKFEPTGYEFHMHDVYFVEKLLFGDTKSEVVACFAEYCLAKAFAELLFANEKIEGVLIFSRTKQFDSMMKNCKV